MVSTYSPHWQELIKEPSFFIRNKLSAGKTIDLDFDAPRVLRVPLMAMRFRCADLTIEPDIG